MTLTCICRRSAPRHSTINTERYDNIQRYRLRAYIGMRNPFEIKGAFVLYLYFCIWVRDTNMVKLKKNYLPLDTSIVRLDLILPVE